jgi:hypothetical protein
VHRSSLRSKGMTSKLRAPAATKAAFRCFSLCSRMKVVLTFDELTAAPTASTLRGGLRVPGTCHRADVGAEARKTQLAKVSATAGVALTNLDGQRFKPPCMGHDRKAHSNRRRPRHTQLPSIAPNKQPDAVASAGLLSAFSNFAKWRGCEARLHHRFAWSISCCCLWSPCKGY